MIILPDRNIPRARFLMPVFDREWREPSQHVSRDIVGNPIQQTRFKLTARSHDGVTLWTGWFDDREDFDAFLEAIALGTLHNQPALWDLPSPYWPELDPDILYAVDTVTFLTANTNTTYNKPSDWNDGANTIECIGAGGKGSVSGSSGACSVGGGGGAYSKKLNFTFSGASTTYLAGLNGGTSADTYFGATTFASSSCGAKGGTNGGSGSGGAGGLATSGIGDTKFNGGSGGSSGNSICASGGGGAGGPSGAGNGSTAPGSNASTAGGSGNAGNGASGSAGTTNSASLAGGDGTVFDATHGCGGGSGGSTATSFPNLGTSGRGGNYGGGSGGTGSLSAGGTPGTPGPGLVVVTYTPAVASGFNMPMLGM